MISLLLQKLLGGHMLSKILESLISKKRVIGWGASLAFAVAAGFLGMQTQEFKAAVCDAPVMEQK